MVYDLLDAPIHVSTHVGDSVSVDKVHYSCSIMFIGYQTQANLVILDMVDFDNILGMSWLYSYLPCNSGLSYKDCNCGYAGDG